MNTVKSLTSCLAIAFALTSLASVSRGEGGAPAADAAAQVHKVGLIDMAYVFKNYKKFEAMREDLKVEISKSEEEAKEMATQIQAIQGKMKQLQEGSPEFTAMEKELASQSADFETFRRAAQRDFLKRESQIYHTVYMEATDAVKKYADYYKYTLVLRFSKDELDKDNPQALIQGMNKQVVYYRESEDITQPVLDFLNRKYQGASAGGAPTNSAKGAPTKPGPR